ncbi:single-stranded DNA-binding protein [Garciella nitratireducens]|uniref:Single-stranded DNA-binding protein n=1 Tax=Garciella nitratireducens DSM 15102 TaxID=1121911 RepID=A0A1T4PF66_9FIRM|nr:single-stranded DNA-binding protein [Garciella nitratireducens]SJZ89977.1 single-strand binding protein [Garciella nitratireducens DSM 15102]
MLNKVCLVGRLTKDPELRYLANGTPVANFTLAVNRTFKNRNGEREADFINIVVWRKQAENCANYIGKGSLVSIVGRIQTRSYDGADGQRRYVTEVVAEEVQFLDSKNSRNSQQNQTSNDFDTNDVPLDDLYPIDGDEEDLPF